MPPSVTSSGLAWRHSWPTRECARCPPSGECRVVACAGAAGNRRGLCRVHDGRWRWHRRHVPDLNFDHWCQTQPRPWIDAARVVLAGLAPLVQTELLYGLRERCRQDCYVLAAAIQTAVRRAFSSPELERRKPTWDMSVFGHPGTLSFAKITQPWLR